MSGKLEVLTEQLTFGEAPRWRDGKLWFSDIKGYCVKTVDLSAEVETVIPHIEGMPSGLGWLPGGDLLVVSMENHKVMRVCDGQVAVYADTSAISRYLLNDLIVDQHGHAFVSNMGYNYEAGEAFKSTSIIRVRPDGSVSPAADDISIPNGLAISGDGNLLLVAQCGAPEILAFDLAGDGELSNRRVYASLPEGAIADGICLDEEGAVWVASPLTCEFIRIDPREGITHRVSTGSRHAIACALGGHDRKTLFCMTAKGMSLSLPGDQLDGRIEILGVEVPGAGRP